MPPSTYPLPCDSEATEAVEQQLASVRREWIRRYDERKREVGLAPVLVPEDDAPRHVSETGAQAGADDDPHDDESGDQGDAPSPERGALRADQVVLCDRGCEAPSPERGALRADHVVLCGCGCGGVSDQSLRCRVPAAALARVPRRCSAACLPGSATRRFCIFFA